MLPLVVVRERPSSFRLRGVLVYLLQVAVTTYFMCLVWMTGLGLIHGGPPTPTTRGRQHVIAKNTTQTVSVLRQKITAVGTPGVWVDPYKAILENNSGTIGSKESLRSSTEHGNWRTSKEKVQKIIEPVLKETAKLRQELLLDNPLDSEDHGLRVGSPVKSKTSSDGVTTVRPRSCSGCFPHNLNYVVSPILLCEPTSREKPAPDLLIMISSIARNIAARNAIRKTWGSFTRGNTAKRVRYVFLFGRPRDLSLQKTLLKESAEFGDILQEDFFESYQNLTLKTMLAFTWATSYCAQAKFVMKTDEDVFVNVPNLLRLLILGRTEVNNVIIGKCTQTGVPVRNKRSKYYVSELQYPEDKYRGFCSGTGYVVPMHIVHDIVKISPDVPFFHLEDVYVGLCADKLGYKLKHVRGFHSGFYPLVASEGQCDIPKLSSTTTSHYMKPKDMHRVWNLCDIARNMPKL